MSESAGQLLVDAYIEAQEAAVLEVADQGLITLSGLVDSGAIDVSPTFQRRDRWKPDQQSALIESFMTNIPVPPVYLAEDKGRLGRYAVIDGKQRLTSIATFFSDELLLRGLTRLPQFNGLRYSDLPEEIRNSLGIKSLRVTTLLRSSLEEFKHEVFLRLNTGGEVLNPQEIRNVAYRGSLNDLIYSLAENKFLRKQFKAEPPSSSAYRKMLDAEYVLRFMSLNDSWQTFPGDLRSHMDRFMWSNADRVSQADLDRLEQTFVSAIEAAEAIWGPEAFKRPGRDQALAGLYDAQMIALASLSAPQVRKLVGSRAEVVTASNELFGDEEFDQAVRLGTNTPSRLQYRTKRMSGVLAEIAGPA